MAVAEGAMSALETVQDALSAIGVAIVKGAMAAVEAGADVFSGTNVEQEQYAGGGFSGPLQRRQRAKENDEAFLLAVLI